MQSIEAVKSAQSVEVTAACACTVSPVMLIAEAAPVLRRSKSYLYGGIRDGWLPAVRFGRGLGLPRALVQGFVDEVVQLGLPISFEAYAAAWLVRASEGAA